MARLTAVYHVQSEANAVEARAKAIAVEQSVEMPIEAITDASVLTDIVGQVETITALGPALFEVRIGLALATTGLEAGQLFNMLFGNISLQDDVTLVDIILPDQALAAFGGPSVGIAGLRRMAGAEGRAMTCAALKPQGLPASGLATIAERLTLGGIDFIKDDHGLADQSYSRYADRVGAVAAAVRRAGAATGHKTRYLPSLSGTLDAVREQIRLGRSEGIDTFLASPLILGLPTFHAVVRENPGVAFFAHPTLTGLLRILPPVFYGRLFRLLGADAVIFPNYGGRFGYSQQTCRDLAGAARAAWGGLAPSLPVPAGGMTLERVPEILDFYGPDTLLLIGGALLTAGDKLTETSERFSRMVADASSPNSR